MKKIIVILLFLSILPFTVFAQEAQGPVAILEYFDDAMEIEITDPNGNFVDFVEYGMDIAIGSTIQTFGSIAEIRLDPNGSIVKLAYDTTFVIESLDENQQLLLKMSTIER